MTHNDNIRMFDDIQRHLKLEDEHLETAKASSKLYMTYSSKVTTNKHEWDGNFYKKEQTPNQQNLIKKKKKTS